MLKLLFAKQLEEYEYNNSSNSNIVKKYTKTDDICDHSTTNHLPINEHDDWGFFVELDKIPTTNHYEKHSNSHTITIAPYEINRNPTMTPQLYNNNKNDDYSVGGHASLFTCLSVATIIIMYYF